MNKCCLPALSMVFMLFVSPGINLQAQEGPPDEIQFSFKIFEGRSNSYKPGDILLVKIIAEQTGKFCNKGIERTCIFTKGLHIKNQDSWVSEGAGKWYKIVRVVILESRNNESVITAYRKTDKGEVVERLYLKKQEIKSKNEID